MKAILEFDMDDLDDRNSHMRAIKSTQAYLALFQVREFLFKVRDKDEVSDNILEEFNAIVDHYDIDLDRELE
jgi:hypothetical protein